MQGHFSEPITKANKTHLIIDLMQFYNEFLNPQHWDQELPRYLQTPYFTNEEI